MLESLTQKEFQLVLTQKNDSCSNFGDNFENFSTYYLLFK